MFKVNPVGTLRVVSRKSKCGIPTSKNNDLNEKPKPEILLIELQQCDLLLHFSCHIVRTENGKGNGCKSITAFDSRHFDEESHKSDIICVVNGSPKVH